MGCGPTLATTSTMIMTENQHTMITKDMFVFNALIGEGGFGKVLSGMLIKLRTWYAVKEINKVGLIEHKTGLSMLFGELEALQKVNTQNAFIVGLQAAFHDK
jgi:hypothetical protein